MGEAKLLMSLKPHNNIVKCYNCMIENGKVCIVQEYCDKGDLKQAIQAQKQ